MEMPENMFGTIQSVRIETAGPHSLFGVVVGAPLRKDYPNEETELKMERSIL